MTISSNWLAQAGAHANHAGAPAGQPVVFTGLLLAAALVVAGVAVARPVAGPPGPKTRRVVWTAVWAVVAAGLVSIVLGTLRLPTVALFAAAATAVALLVSQRWAAFAGGVLLIGLLVVPTAFTPGLFTGPARAEAEAESEPGTPHLLAAQVGGEHLPVLVTPGRPGRNLVHLPGADPVLVGPDAAHLVRTTDRPGASGQWATVTLPAGEGELVLRGGGQTATVHVDTGDGSSGPASVVGPDGPECAAVALGGAVTGHAAQLRGCPSQRLSPVQTDQLRGLVAFIAGRKVPAIAVVADESPRSTAAAAVVREAAERHRIPLVRNAGPDDAVVVVAGWAKAHRALAGIADRQFTRPAPTGVYLAPWLLSPSVVKAIPGTLVASPFDPRGEQAARYEVALARRFHGEGPTAAGYTGWAQARGVAVPADVRLYAASVVSVMPRSVGHQHGSTGGWLPGGTVVPVTGPLERR